MAPEAPRSRPGKGRFLVPLAAMGLVVPVAGCGATEVSVAGSSPSSPAVAASTDGVVTSAVRKAAAAFVALLDDHQRSLLQDDYLDTAAKHAWTGLPAGSSVSTSAPSYDASGSVSKTPDAHVTSSGGAGPSTAPSGMPTGRPSGMPTGRPSGMPSGVAMPTGAPGGRPSASPTSAPTAGDGTSPKGLSLSDLDREQWKAAMAVVEAFLSDQGADQVDQIMAAGDALDDSRNDSGGDAGRARDPYAIAFFGDPTTDGSFMIQFDGRDLAINADFQNGAVSIAPEFTGVEAVSDTDAAGNDVQVMRGEGDTLFDLLASLSDEELAEAELGVDETDLVKGPGTDDTAYPDDQYDGILVADLTEDQQDLVATAISMWAGDLDDSISDAVVATYVAEFGETRVAWAGSSDADADDSYVRISGPSVWIEYSRQPGVGEASAHIRTVYRDKTSDYEATVRG